jgi:hypothetical protein
MVSSTAATVPEYLASLSPERRKVVAAMRRFIREHLPKGYREAMSFGMIGYEPPLSAYPRTYNGKPLVYVALAAQQNNYALYLTCAYLDEARAERLRKAWTAMGRRPDMGKSCLRFKSPEDLPLEAIGREIASTPPTEFIRRHEAGRG